ncbi:MAG: CRISPR-associated endonuclease Cas2 [Candidatus Azambacteria bacterium]|nr:CRISPR-associated endonuclease Cas2 [Candidatus Azambacteria bacterium]
MKKSKIGKDFLKYLALGGLVTVAMLSPINGHKVAKDLVKHVKYKLKQLKNNAYYLKKRGHIEFVKENSNEIVVRITDGGRKYLKTFDIDNMALNRPERWDGKWRLVIFDVPEKHKNAREALRRKLKDLCFFRLQDSAWVTPHPCDDEIRFLREIFNISFNVDVFTISDLKHHEIKLKKHFNIA